jgi:SOS-response transcriptional repressor LexA
MKHEDDRIILKKKNPAFPAVTLPPTGWMLIGTVVELVKRNENYIEEV